MTGNSTATMPNANKLEISGNLTADPVFDATARRLVFRIANNRNYKDQNDKWHRIASFFNVAIWGALAVKLAEELAKGDGVVLKGRLSSNSWTGRDGKRRYDTEIVAYKVDHYPKTARVEVDDNDQAVGDAGQSIAQLALESPLVAALMAKAISAVQMDELLALCVRDGTTFSWDPVASELTNDQTSIVIEHADLCEVVSE